MLENHRFYQLLYHRLTHLSLFSFFLIFFLYECVCQHFGDRAESGKPEVFKLDEFVHYLPEMIHHDCTGDNRNTLLLWPICMLASNAKLATVLNLFVEADTLI